MSSELAQLQKGEFVKYLTHSQNLIKFRVVIIIINKPKQADAIINNLFIRPGLQGFCLYSHKLSDH